MSPSVSFLGGPDLCHTACLSLTMDPTSENTGKEADVPSLVNVLGSNQWSEDVVPTVAFNLRQVRKGNVTMKVWDVAVSSSDPFGDPVTTSTRMALSYDWKMSIVADVLRDSRSLGGCGIGIVEGRMR